MDAPWRFRTEWMLRISIPTENNPASQGTQGEQTNLWRALSEMRQSFLPSPRPLPDLLSETAWVPLEGTGSIVAYTIQYQTTSAFIKRCPLSAPILNWTAATFS